MGFMKDLIVIGLLSGACLVGAAQERDKASYRLCDFHQHTTFSDGVYSLGYDFEACDSLDLAWWANSEHGGPSRYNGLVSGKDKGRFVEWEADEIIGDADPENPHERAMWRWQTLSEYSFPEIVRLRERAYPERVFPFVRNHSVPLAEDTGGPSYDALRTPLFRNGRSRHDHRGDIPTGSRSAQHSDRNIKTIDIYKL